MQPLGIISDLFGSNATVFSAFMIIVGGLIGMISRKLIISAYGGFIVFVYVAVNTDLFIYKELLYVFLTVVFVVLGFKFWDTSTSGGVEQ